MRNARVPPEIVAALNEGRRSGKWIRACCPWCSTSGFDRPIAARVDDPSDWRCFRCRREEDFRDGATRTRDDAKRRAELRDDTAERKAKAIAIWEASVPIRNGDPADLYLRARQLTPPGDRVHWPDSLRLHSKLWHPAVRRDLPAMVAVVVDVGGMPVAIHRTYLTHDGRKAAVRPVKMMLGPTAGCAVRLGHGPRIIVAEGIESALGAAMVHRDLAPWSALSAAGLESLQIPRDVTRIVCARDRGKAGRKAANTLRARVAAAELEQQRLIHFAVASTDCDFSEDKDFADR